MDRLVQLGMVFRQKSSISLRHVDNNLTQLSGGHAYRLPRYPAGMVE
jgi:hypothetical protein